MTNPDSEDEVDFVPPRRLARVKEACIYGKIGETELYDYLNDGTIKAYKRRSTTLVDLDTIDAFYASLSPYVPRAKQRHEKKPGGAKQFEKTRRKK
jgi:hypothetical protein